MRLSALFALSAFFALASATCTPGTYICGPRPVDAADSAIYVCDSSEEYALVADCAADACRKEYGLSLGALQQIIFSFNI
ncbi:hypothetical protein NM688_g4170 [Phlebia brevispora]|uniref:Uncharacterized protein n=1 Tax=Phlebia brevispora TaxID=194682 RepID=A0ACC1T3S1_9APHY|nr:hypothetical protein NM688_g4170 [Phlebia brevispora]